MFACDIKMRSDEFKFCFLLKIERRSRHTKTGERLKDGERGQSVANTSSFWTVESREQRGNRRGRSCAEPEYILVRMWRNWNSFYECPAHWKPLRVLIFPWAKVAYRNIWSPLEILVEKYTILVEWKKSGASRPQRRGIQTGKMSANLMQRDFFHRNHSQPATCPH